MSILQRFFFGFQKILLDSLASALRSKLLRFADVCASPSHHIRTAYNALFEPQVPNFSCPKHVRWDTRLMPSPSVWIWWGLKFVYYWVWTYYLSCIEIVVQTTKMTNIKIASETKCTVVVVGDSRTGKSALLQRFSQKTFQPVSF